MRVKRVVKSLIGKLAGSESGKRVFAVVLDDPEVTGWLSWYMADQQAIGQASFTTDLPDDILPVVSFQDLVWLWQSGLMNQRLSRTTFAEGAWLYELLRSWPWAKPRVLEIGTFKGGTTFLMAAVGAEVTTIDVVDHGSGELTNALKRVGLDGRVRFHLGDAIKVPDVIPASMDVIYMDVNVPPEQLLALINRWLPALAYDGRLIVHALDPIDERYSEFKRRMVGVREVLQRLDDRSDLERLDVGPPSYIVYAKYLSCMIDP